MGRTEVCIAPRLKIGRGIKSEDDETPRAGSNDIRRGDPPLSDPVAGKRMKE